MIILGATDTTVVVGDDAVVDKEKSGSSVGNGAGDGTSRCGPDAVSINVEGPETIAGVDVDIGDVAGVGRVIDSAEGVGSRPSLLEIGGEQWRRQAGLDVVKEGQLLLGLDGVFGRKSQAEKAIVAGVLLELGAHLFGELDSLVGECGLANSNGIGVDISTGAALITIGDAPGVALELLGGARLGWVVGVVTIDFVRRGLSGEDPAIKHLVAMPNKIWRWKDSQIRGPSIEVEGELLTTDGDWSQVLRVVLSRVGGDTAIVPSRCICDVLRNWLAILLVCTSESDRTGLDARLGHGLLDHEILILLRDDRRGRSDSQEGRSRSDVLGETHDERLRMLWDRDSAGS